MLFPLGDRAILGKCGARLCKAIRLIGKKRRYRLNEQKINDR
jgi:hypothetical protein